MKKYITVTNDRGREFNVIIVLLGERYGLNDCQTNNDSEPFVEFWDAHHVGEKISGTADLSIGRESRILEQPGQFVSRYNLSTLLGVGRHGSGGFRKGQGLDLHGGVREWGVSYENVQTALRFAWSRLMESMPGEYAEWKREEWDVREAPEENTA